MLNIVYRFRFSGVDDLCAGVSWWKDYWGRGRSRHSNQALSWAPEGLFISIYLFCYLSYPAYKFRFETENWK